MGFEPDVYDGEVAGLYSISMPCPSVKSQKNLKYDEAFHNSLPAETNRLKNESSNS